MIKFEDDKFEFGDVCQQNNKEVDVTIDDKLTVDDAIKNISRKAGQKLCALSRISYFSEAD